VSAIVEKLFRLKANSSSLRQEIVGGFTAFVTMSYIIFVQPLILSTAGMDKGAVMTATCIASALAMIVMAFSANYPFALAPAMGHNVYFVFTVCIAMGITWQVALGANFIAGFIFLIISFWGFREKIVNAVPASLKNAIAVGIGFLITLIGLEWSGIVTADPGTLITLGNLSHPAALLSLFGLLLMAFLISKKVKGAILWGIGTNMVLALIFGLTEFQGIVDKIPSLSPTLFKLNILGALKWEMLGVIFVFFFLDLFDTVGTLIGVSEPAGFLKEGKLPRANQAMFSDAVGTVGGALLGTSTVTSYIESATGIAQGARTGLANIFTSFLFLIALYHLYPNLLLLKASQHSCLKLIRHTLRTYRYLKYLVLLNHLVIFLQFSLSLFLPIYL